MLVKMNDITAGDLLIPGGWHAHVLSITASRSGDICDSCGYPCGEDPALSMYMPTLLQMGFDPDEALELCARMLQTRYTFGFLHGLKEFTRNQAKRYARKYPDLIVKPGEGYKGVPIGFDPERLQAYHLPLAGHGSVLNKRKLDTGIDGIFEVFRAEALTGG